jgi:hypothetical protein
MYLDTPDGRVKAVIKTVHADGTFDWASECGNYSGTGSRLKPKDEKGKVIKPVAEKSEIAKLRDDLIALKAKVESNDRVG